MTSILPERRFTSHGLVRASLVEGDADLPGEADVVVIGGGLIGCMSAYWLAKAGLTVTLVEKGEIGAEASSRAFGLVSDLLLDPAKIDLTVYAKHLWRECAAELPETGFRAHGLAFIADTNEEMEFFAAWRTEMSGAAAQDSSLLSRAELKRLLPDMEAECAGAIHSCSDGSIEPILAASATARAARALGARILTGCAARGIETSGGAVSAVVTERGAIRTRQVVCAANVWARLFCGNLGIDLPQLYHFQTIGRVTGIANGPTFAAGSTKGAWRPQIDGSYTVASTHGARAPITRDSIALFGTFLPMLRENWADVRLSFDADARRDWTRSRRWSLDETTPFEKERILNPRNDISMNRRAVERVGRHFGRFRSAKVLEQWTGALAMSPDNMPVVGMDVRIDGFHIVSGCAYGVTWAPALGRIVADLLTGHEPAVGMRDFGFERFHDGTKLILRH